jgi:hypothetical protein
MTGIAIAAKIAPHRGVITVDPFLFRVCAGFG